MYGERCVQDLLEDSSVVDVMFSIFSAIQFLTSLSLAFSASILGEAGGVGQKLGPQKGNFIQRRDIFGAYRVYRETTEG